MACAAGRAVTHDDRIPPADQRCECPCGCTDPATTRNETAELFVCDGCAGVVPERAAEKDRPG